MNNSDDIILEKLVDMTHRTVMIQLTRCLEYSLKRETYHNRQKLLHELNKKSINVVYYMKMVV